MDERTLEGLYPNPPEDMRELLLRIEREWLIIKDTVARLSEAQLEKPGEGGWSIKDHLAHLTFWEQWMLRHILQGEPSHAVTGISQEELAGLDTDAENDIIYRRNRDRSASDVMADAFAKHDDMVDALSRMPFQPFNEPRFPDRPDEPLGGWVIGNTYGHYMEHAPAIRGLAQGTT